EHARRERGHFRRMPLIEMKATALHHDRHAVERAGHELPFVPGDSGLGESGDILVRHAGRPPDLVREESEPRAQHDGHARLERTQAARNGVGGALDRPTPHAQRPFSCRHNRIPASVADRKFARVPAIMARNQPRKPWIDANSPMASAMRAMNDTSIAITLSIRCRPSVVPRAAASTTFTSVRGISTLTPPRVCGVAVSGSRIFAIMIVPGAV